MRLELSSKDQRLIRYAVDQQIITLRECIARLSDPRMNDTQKPLIAEFKGLIKDLTAVLDKLPEV